MIVQTAPTNKPHFVITMAEHCQFAAQFAQAFGNDRFSPPPHREHLERLIAHHDRGWADYDRHPGLNPDTGLPYSLRETPIPDIVQTSTLSPDLNQQEDPYNGLLSSMHSWGLYNGRYGLSDKITLDLIPIKHRPQVDAMLSGELQRQDRLKTQLIEAGRGDWIETDPLFQSYKLLQFCDTLALYFNLTHVSDLIPALFHSVPISDQEDVDVEITPLEQGRFGLAPYPFAEDDLEVICQGRYLQPIDSPQVDLRQVLADLPIAEQRFTLVRA